MYIISNRASEMLSRHYMEKANFFPSACYYAGGCYFLALSENDSSVSG